MVKNIFFLQNSLNKNHFFIKYNKFNFVKGIATDCIKKSRKRTQNPTKHKSYEKKRKVQTGEEYITKSGRIIAKKEFYVQSECRCAKNCAKRIDALRQEQIFNSYHELKNWTQKTLFLQKTVVKLGAKENLNPIINQKEKKFTNKYYLTDETGQKHQVCFGFLMNCMQITQSKMRSVIKTMTCNEAAQENRGKFPSRKTKESDVSYVKEFISKFPTYQSHYRLSPSNIKYLSPFLNIEKMYREYCLKCQFLRKKPVKIWNFRHIFNTEFNLSFARLKVDTCRTCDKFEALSKSGTLQENVEQERKVHLDLVQLIFEEFAETVKLASDPENHTEIFTFDLQRALQLPCIETSEAFYKRQLWCYNLAVYDEVRRIGYMFFWCENVASRGAQEIGSCLLKHFENNLPKDTQKIILRSDSCTGQNRNIKLALMLKKFLSSCDYSDLTSIEQHFYVSGHSYNSCDRSFGLIERQKKVTEEILVPEHWLNVIRQAKKNEPKFVVIEMKKQDFFSSKSLEDSIINRKKDAMGEKINWFKMQKLIYEKHSPLSLDFVEYGGASVKTIFLQKNCTPDEFASAQLAYLYTDIRPIALLKYKDLQALLKYVPEKYHGFYSSLKHDTDNSSKEDALVEQQSHNEEDFIAEN